MDPAEYVAMRAHEDAHWWYSALRSLVLDELGPARKVLDAGCGTGGMLDRLRDREALGVDVSPLAVESCRRRGLPRLSLASACALPFRDGTFDAVLSLDVIYHLAVPDDALAVAECARVLRPGGKLLLHVPAHAWLSGEHDRATHGVRRYDRRRVRELVRRSGLEVERLTHRNAFALPFAIVRRRLAPGPAGRGSDLAACPPAIDSALRWIGRAENRLIRRASIPAGLSVWCVAVKPAGGWA